MTESRGRARARADRGHDHAAHLHAHVRRPDLRPGGEPRQRRGRDRRDPARGPGDPRRQPHLEPRRGRPRLVADAEARSAYPLARQEGAVRLAVRRLGGRERWGPPGRPRCGRRRGVPAGPADPRRGPHPVRLPRRDAQPGRRSSRRPRTVWRSSPSARAPRSSRSRSPAPTGSGRRARSCRTPAGTSRHASGARSARPTNCPRDTDRRTAKPLVTRMIMERIAALLPPSQRGVYGADEDPVR